MTDPASPAPEQRFSGRVENYVRFRPGYPQEIIPLLQTEAGLDAASVVADVGSGTGISAKMLLQAGCIVHAVEPNREMRAAAEGLLGSCPAFHSVSGSAQATTLPAQSVDIVVAAQAFHWFNTPETRAEFSRILKPRPAGHVVLIWNERRLDATSFLRDYEHFLLTYATDYTAVRHENVTPAALSRFFIGPFASHAFLNEQRFDFEGLKGRLLSCSYAPAEGHPRHPLMMAGLNRLFDRHQKTGEVVFEYVTQVYLGR